MKADLKRLVRPGIALAVVTTLGWVAACSDDLGGPCSTCQDSLPQGLIVSNPVPATGIAAGAAAAHASSAPANGAADSVTYVSLTPGTAPAGSRAVVRRVGDAASVTAAVVAGGFDPVPIVAQAGDSIEVTVTDASGATVFAARVAVAARRPPVIVRTDPPPKKRDVPLNASMVIVFSEPIDSSTLTPTSVQLLQSNRMVPGTVSLLAGTATSAVFVPAAPLDANADYQLVVTQVVRDLDRDALEAEVAVDFTTGTAVAGPVASVTLAPDSVTLLVQTTVQLSATLRDANNTVVSGRPIAWTSDNSAATVDGNGLVTGVGDGTAMITATAEGKSGSAKVSVVPVGQIAFVSDRDGNDEIYVMNQDGSGQVNLTSTPGANEYAPVWSPDGTKIAFVRGQSCGRRCYHRDIFVMNADGSGVTQLTNTGLGQAPVWSPDGTRIAFWSYPNGEIYVMNADGSGQVNLTPGANNSVPVWSPDARRIATTSNRDGNYEIYMMNADGSGQANLTNNPASDYNPAWSPDGTRIAFSSSRDGYDEIFVMNADGSGQVNFTSNPGDNDNLPVWSPDGTKIAFVRVGAGEIYVMNADGSGLLNVSSNPGYDYAPDWSPDGTRIAFQSGNGEIYVMNADGSGQVNLTNNPGSDGEPAWRPR